MSIKKAQPNELPEIKILRPKKFGDERGFFSEVYRFDMNNDLGLADSFIQDNHAYSRDAGVLRGLHYQAPPFAQDKLLRVVRGSIWDVVVDIRNGSETYGRWMGVELSAENWQQIFVPKGFAHGYITLEKNTEVLYKVTNPYAPEHDFGIAWDDPDLAIDWKLEDGEQAVLSEKDTHHPRLKDAKKHFTIK